jgi:hypothetical protein
MMHINASRIINFTHRAKSLPRSGSSGSVQNFNMNDHVLRGVVVAFCLGHILILDLNPEFGISQKFSI